MLQICRRKKLKDQMELCDIAILKRLFLTLKDCQKLAMFNAPFLCAFQFE